MEGQSLGIHTYVCLAGGMLKVLYSVWTPRVTTESQKSTYADPKST